MTGVQTCALPICYFPITAQAQVAWAVENGVKAAVTFIQEQIESGLLDGGVARCRATMRATAPRMRTSRLSTSSSPDARAEMRCARRSVRHFR